MENDSSLDFNFWTAFADLMLSLLLVLCMLLFVIIAVITLGTVNLKQVETNQMVIVKSVAERYRAEIKDLPNIKDAYGIRLPEELRKSIDEDLGFRETIGNDIEIYNDLDKQRITFSEWILFDSGNYELKTKGKDVLKVVGDVIKTKLDRIKQIQIEGHADTDLPKSSNNTQLAANRAISVFFFFKDMVGIKPEETLMSATSFGEYNSVQRVRNPDPYNKEKLDADNKDLTSKSRNRRIEIVLFYRR
ncbi:MAG: OmpA family protein [Acidobacteria bacterium]|nr:OmpA family protein [Acidobacteriota bacterium]